MEDIDLFRATLTFDFAEDVNVLVNVCFLQFLPCPICSSSALLTTLLRWYAPVRFVCSTVAPAVEVALRRDELPHAGDWIERDHLRAHMAKLFVADCAPICDAECLPDQWVIALPAVSTF